MENASKALIIAGAILISILLIGVGVLVMNGAQGGIDEAVQSMSAQEKQMFNQKFEQYEGDKVKGSNVKALIGNIISSNGANEEIAGKKVTLNGKSTTDDMTKIRTAINSGKTYKVTLTYNAYGLVTAVKVEGDGIGTTNTPVPDDNNDGNI